MKNLLKLFLNKGRKKDEEKEETNKIVLKLTNFHYGPNVNPEIWPDFPKEVRGYDVISSVFKTPAAQLFDYSGRANLVFQFTQGGEDRERRYEGVTLHMRDFPRKVE